MTRATRCLVIGAGRSGTSLLFACLDGHPSITMRSEYCSAEILIGDDQPVEVECLLDERLRRFRAACEADRDRSRGMIWGNKITTEQISGLEEHNVLNGTSVDVVARFSEVMADYGIIFITRDGRACIEANLRRVGQPMARSALFWCYCCSVHRRLKNNGRLLATVRYEDLVTAPKEVLTGLCDRLGIVFDAGMLQQTASPHLLPEYRHGRFLAENATAVPAVPEPIFAMIRRDLAYLGYIAQG
jgi:Sulfotransferase family